MQSSSSVEAEYRRLPFDLYQRYEVVRAVASSAGQALGHPASVLDVGGLAFSNDGIGRFLPIKLCLPDNRAVTLDTQECALPDYVKAMGEDLPFAEASFDVVASCDTLEHVQPAGRESFVVELLRVSADFVVLVVPCAGHLNNLAERILDAYITGSLDVIHPQLREHLANGLPERDDIGGWLADRGHCYVDFPSGYIYNWLAMMLARHYLMGLPKSAELVTMIDEFYNAGLSVQDHRAPAYRQVFLISKSGRSDVLSDVKRRFSALPAFDPSDGRDQASTIFQLAFTLLDIRQRREADQEVRTLIAQKEAHIAHLETLVVERERAVADLRGALAEYAARVEALEDRLADARAKLDGTFDRRALRALGRARRTLRGEKIE